MTQTDRDTPVTALLEAVRDYVEWFDSPRRSYRRDGTHGRILAKFRAALASSDDVAGSGERLDADSLASAMDNAFEFDDVFIDDHEGFWRPFAVKVIAELGNGSISTDHAFGSAAAGQPSVGHALPAPSSESEADGDGDGEPPSLTARREVVP